MAMNALANSGIPSSTTDTAALMWHIFNYQTFWNYENMGKYAILTPKSHGDVSSSTGISGILVRLAFL